MNPPRDTQQPADASQAEQRLDRLFRRTLGEQRLHPLYALLRHYRGLADALPPTAEPDA